HHGEMEGSSRKLIELQGRWPDFALEFDKQARNNRRIRMPDKPLGPCKPDEFVAPVRQFIDELRTDPTAAKKLDEARGKWPDYPFAIMSLAKEKNKRVPGTYLPGAKDFWDQAKSQPE